ncbi:hypothetical protein BKA59DRAFT_554144 [Fusarium tricinctum]|uniref:Uncharacterized protein n=1 Tax=Fusarium tricinctum TaxID=61284 RepID=A0A8K0WD61_9HYPO|nr:hypothetical protein BKA59DRAFT_554144 [Fusarium tricinctum]
MITTLLLTSSSLILHLSHFKLWTTSTSYSSLRTTTLLSSHTASSNYLSKDPEQLVMSTTPPSGLPGKNGVPDIRPPFVTNPELLARLASILREAVDLASPGEKDTAGTADTQWNFFAITNISHSSFAQGPNLTQASPPSSKPGGEQRPDDRKEVPST